MKTMKFGILMILGALFVGTGNVKAQDEQKKFSEERMRLRAELMALDMADKYDLNENQVKQLTEANLNLLKQQGNTPRPHFDGRQGFRHRDHNARRGGCCCGNSCKEGCCGNSCKGGQGEFAPPAGDNGHAPLSKEELDKRKEEQEKAREEFKAVIEAYNTALQSILTEEQYEAYKKRQMPPRADNRKPADAKQAQPK